ncbi:unnamed protein product [Prunus armeniaca]
MGLLRVLEKGVALIAKSVVRVPKATTVKLSFAHVSGPHRLFILADLVPRSRYVRRGDEVMERSNALPSAPCVLSEHPHLERHVACPLMRNGAINVPFGYLRRTVLIPRLINRSGAGQEVHFAYVSEARALYRRFLTKPIGNPGYLPSSAIRDKMSDSESPFESEPNAFDGESSDDQWDTNSEAVSLDAEGEKIPMSK